MAPELDIVIPVYNEGGNIRQVLDALRAAVRTPYRILLCYDHEEDDTLPVVRASPDWPERVCLVKNRGRGAHAAIRSGFEASTAGAVLVFPADDVENAGIVDEMVRRQRQGYEVVAASRFMPGGSMVGCPWLKAILVRTAAFTLRHFARLPVHDPSNGFRLFSRRVLAELPIESSIGFTYSLELLAKCHRLGWPIGEVPSHWRERTRGTSRFRVLRWLPAYLRWYAFAFATTWLRRSPATVLRKAPRV